MTKSVGTGALFQQSALSRFKTLTAQRYTSMLKRIAGKKLPAPTFDLEGFRAWACAAMGGTWDGAIQCRYCKRYIALEESAADHMTPLSRGGSSVDIHNIGFPCDACNSRKGSMLPWEYEKLVAFLRQEIPLAETDVLKRLQQSVKAVAGAKRNAMLIKEVKAGGHWPSKKKKVAPPIDDF